MSDISFSSIHVDNGQELGDPPQVSVHSAGRNTARAGDRLIVFFDLPNAHDSTLREVGKALSSSYWNGPGGVTTALRLAMRVANDKLIDLNRGVPAEQRAEGSITCVVSNAESLVLAQAGPAIAYARSKGGAFEPILPQDAASLIGSTRTVDVYFSNFTPKIGDVFVVTGAGSCINVNERLIEMCMSKGDARTVAGYLNANVKQGRMVGVAISVDVASTFSVAQQELAMPKPRSTQPQPTLQNASAAAPTTTRPPIPQTQTAQPQPSQLPPAQTQRKAQDMREPRADAVGDALKSTGESLSTAAKSIQRSLSAFGGQLLPTEDREALDRANENGRAINFVLAAIALLLPILVGVVVTILYLQFSGEVERQELKRTALAAVQAAEQAPNASDLRAAWPRALDAIAAYEAKNPADAAATFTEARAKARAQLDQLSKVTRIQPILYSALDAGQHRLSASAFGVYVINRSTNSGQSFVMLPDRSQIQGKGFAMVPSQQIANVPLDFVDVAYATTTGGRWRTEGAFVIGKIGLFEYRSDTGKIGTMPVPATALTALVQAQAGELYDNKAYVLDSGLGQIWRFYLSLQNPSDGFVKVDSYFRNPYPPLKTGLDIGIDGAIYVLQNNGAVLKYFNQAQQPLALAGYPDSFGQPVALAIRGSDPSAGSLLIADAASGSIIEFSKAGAFVRQFRSAGDEFVGLQDISLDAATNTLYVVTNDKLMGFKIE
jgi:hypothetical protein